MPVGSPFFICWLLIEVHGVEECFGPVWVAWIRSLYSLYVRCYSIFAIFDCLLKNLEGDPISSSFTFASGRPILQQTSRACVGSLCPDDTPLFLSKHHMEAAVTLEPKHPPWATSARSKSASPNDTWMYSGVPILKCSSVVLL
jgi:hypothetical protein